MVSFEELFTLLRPGGLYVCEDLKLIETPAERWALAALVAALTGLPLLASPFLLDLANQAAQFVI